MCCSSFSPMSASVPGKQRKTIGPAPYTSYEPTPLSNRSGESHTSVTAGSNDQLAPEMSWISLAPETMRAVSDSESSGVVGSAYPQASGSHRGHLTAGGTACVWTMTVRVSVLTRWSRTPCESLDAGNNGDSELSACFPAIQCLLNQIRWLFLRGAINTEVEVAANAEP